MAVRVCRAGREPAIRRNGAQLNDFKEFYLMKVIMRICSVCNNSSHARLLRAKFQSEPPNAPRQPRGLD